MQTLPRSLANRDVIDGVSDDDNDVIPNEVLLAATLNRVKPSVAEYVMEGITTLGRKVVNLPAPVSRTSRNVTLSRSFLPEESQDRAGSLSEDSNPIEHEVFFNKNPDISEQVSDADGDKYEAAIDNKVVLRPSRRTDADETDRPRSYGIGVVGEALGWDYKKSLRRNRHVLKQLDDIDDYRPYFSYWVTFVQMIIMIISLMLYGFGPVGVELYQGKGQVLSRGLFIEEVDYLEPSNFWFGPRPADLIHLGAKFSPCMRRDKSIDAEISTAVEKEAETGCCVRNDNSGCVQTLQAECSTLLSTWHKWSVSAPGPDGRVSGPVCGQDPQYCTAPKSSYQGTWHDNISTWPVCHVSSLPRPGSYFGLGSQSAQVSSAPRHMTCELIARPCCIGIHGKCEIRTKEYCDFVNGYFHPEANLCSQVSCMEDVCGMLPFVSQNIPDQFYRVWTSLFLHAGLLHMLISTGIQLYLMRDMEKLCGPVRMAIIYLGSGMAGNLASAIFIPYRAESGPAGAQFGVLACLIVEVINVWPILLQPNVAIGKLLAILFIFFCLGLLPWVDNYAHIVGFVSGFLLSYALMPYIAYDRSVHTRSRRSLTIVMCLISVIIIFLILILIFYYVPFYNCSWCKYLTCIPFTKDFCADQNINFKKDAPILNF